MIWPVAALAVLLLGFVVAYGTRLQGRVERAAFAARREASPGSDT